jgi:ankyrin repeat protein
VNECDLSGVTPLFLAVFTGNTDVVQALLDAGADPLQSSKRVSPLHICAERGFVEIARALINKSPQIIKAVDEEGNLALHVACDWD